MEIIRNEPYEDGPGGSGQVINLSYTYNFRELYHYISDQIITRICEKIVAKFLQNLAKLPATKWLVKSDTFNIFSDEHNWLVKFIGRAYMYSV